MSHLYLKDKIKKNAIIFTVKAKAKAREQRLRKALSPTKAKSKITQPHITSLYVPMTDVFTLLMQICQN